MFRFDGAVITVEGKYDHLQGKIGKHEIEEIIGICFPETLGTIRLRIEKINEAPAANFDSVFRHQMEFGGT